jgi:glycosyltransferase involved in cell wall biosynthesis
MHNSLPPVPGWRYALWKVKFGIITRFKRFNIFASNEDAKLSLKPLVNSAFYERIKVTFTNVNPEEVDEALTSELDRQGMLTKFNIPADKFLIFCVGQFIDRKGRWTFLEAAQKVKAIDQDVAFVWISNSKPSEDALEKIKSYSLGDDFVFIVSDQVGAEHLDLFKLMRLADVFALISVQEGLPISLLEAMALGIPSISTNVNAIPEAIKHLETGWLIESGDVESLVSAITLLKANSKLRSKLSENGRKLVLERFNEIEVAKIAMNQYRDSCKRN